MEAGFWHSRWENNEIGFHEGEVNTLLQRHFTALALPAGSRVFVPLCGKTRDIAWLLTRDYQVVGVELSRIAVEQLFSELGVAPEISEQGELTRFHAEAIDIWVGDFFALDADILGPVDAIYDRAALIALPQEMRERYTRHLLTITGTPPQCLICLSYDQSLMNGPPFSVDAEEVRRHYASAYDLQAVETRDTDLKGRMTVTETLWVLT